MPGFNTAQDQLLVAKLNPARIYDAIRRGVNVAAFAAFVSAQNRAPVRRVFYGHRARAPRLLSLQEAQLELPELRRLNGGIEGPFPRFGVKTNDSFRPKHNSWQSTGPRGASNESQLTGRALLTHLEKLEKDEVPEESEQGVGPRSVTRTAAGNRLTLQSAQENLTYRGLYELKSGKAIINNVLGGGLRKSITFHPAEIGEKKIKASVSAGNEKVDYAKYVEFGTRHASAQPFMRPALKVAAERLRSDVISALRNR